MTYDKNGTWNIAYPFNHQDAPYNIVQTAPSSVITASVSF